MKQQTHPYYSIFALIMLLLIGCGGNSPSFPSTAIYAATDSSHLLFASWQQDAGTPDLQGKWESWTATFSQDITDMSGPQLMLLTLSGEISTQDQTATLSINGSQLSARPSGDHLNLVGSIAMTPFQPAVLQSIPSIQVENELSAAFSKAVIARKHLSNLQMIESQTSTAPDNNPKTYDLPLHMAEGYVQGIQEQHDKVMSLDNPCGSSALFWWKQLYDPHESLLHLSSVEQDQSTPEQNAQAIAKQTSLGQSLQQMQQAWQEVKATPVSHIPGLSYDWQLSPNEATQAVQLAQERLTRFQGALTTDEQTMGNLKQQARQLAADVQNKVKENGCEAQS